MPAARTSTGLDPDLASQTVDSSTTENPLVEAVIDMDQARIDWLASMWGKSDEREDLQDRPGGDGMIDLTQVRGPALSAGVLVNAASVLNELHRHQSELAKALGEGPVHWRATAPPLPSGVR